MNYVFSLLCGDAFQTAETSFSDSIEETQAFLDGNNKNLSQELLENISSPTWCLTPPTESVNFLVYF